MENSSGISTSANSAEVSIDVPSSTDEVWEAITTDDGLAGWMGDGSSLGREPGDDLTFADIVTGIEREGTVGDIEPGERLTYRWWPKGEPERVTDVEISLEPCEAGTRVVVIESLPTRVILGASLSASSNAVAAWSWRISVLLVAMPNRVPAALAPVC